MNLTQQDLRGYLHVTPFRPFRVHLANGLPLEVPHPDFLFPAREQIVVDNPAGHLSVIPYEAIVRIEFLPQKTKHKN